MKRSSGIACCVMIFICLTFSIPASAQPDAGTILKEHTQPDAPLPDRVPRDMEKKSEGPVADDSGTKVMIKRFRFTGYEGIASEQELQELVIDYVDRELGLYGLQRIASRVTGYLRDEKGCFLSRAYLPEQDITDGVIEIAVITGHMDGKVAVEIREPSRISRSLVQGIADRAVPKDRPMRLKHLERATLLVKDLPGMDGRTTIEPGETRGTSRVKIVATEGPLLKGIISGDNYGDRYTGTYRGTGRFFMMDPLGWGDRVSFSLTEAEHLTLWNAGYTIPLGSSGVTLNSSYTGLSYEVGKELEALKAEGKADSFYADISYPVIRSRKASLWAGTGIEHLTLEDEASGAKTSDRKLLKGTAFVSGNLFDDYFGRGLTSASIALTSGDVDLSGLASNEADDNAGAKTSGGFFKGTYHLARLQRVTDLISLYGFLRGQFASGNLDSSQKIILGGPRGVRAYPVGEAPGDEGHLFTFEIRVDLPFMPAWASTQITGFFDTGRIKQHKEVWPGSLSNATGKNEYTLSGAGIGFNMAKAGLYRLSVCYAREIGSNDGESADGKDSDNQDHGHRFWLNLTIEF